MSKANVAQEPSMDEILASIRRIIETGEERGGTAGAGRLMPARLPRLDPPVEASFAADAAVPAIDTVAMSESEDLASSASSAAVFEAWGNPATRPPYAMTRVAEAERQTSASFVEGAALPPRPSDEPLDDDHDLTAALESELAASWGQFDEPLQPAGRDDMRPLAAGSPAAAASPIMYAVVSDHSAEGSDAMTDPSPSVAARDHDTVIDDVTRQETPMQERGSFEPANTDQRGLGAEAEGVASRYSPFADDASPLASHMTGSLVAASFEELGHAIRNGELKSLETMAQEMLRPMLQEWLDDNLPRMVERLVREEIERMSRGGRR